MDLTYYLFLHSDIYHYIFRIRHDQSYPDLPSNGWSFHDDDLNPWKPSSVRRSCQVVRSAWIYYQVKANAAKHVAVAADDDFEEEEDI